MKVMSRDLACGYCSSVLASRRSLRRHWNSCKFYPESRKYYDNKFTPLVKTNTLNNGADKVSAESSVSRPVPVVEASDAPPDEPPEEEERLGMPPSSEMELPDQVEAQADHVNPVSRKDKRTRIIMIDLTTTDDFSKLSPTQKASASSSLPSPPMSARPAFSPISLLSKRPIDNIPITQSTYKHKESSREIQDFYTKSSYSQPILPLSESSSSSSSFVAALSVPTSSTSLGSLSQLPSAVKEESVTAVPITFAIPAFSSASGHQESRDNSLTPVNEDVEDEKDVDGEDDDSEYEPETIPSYFRDSNDDYLPALSSHKNSGSKSKKSLNAWECSDRGEYNKTSNYVVATCKYCHEKMDGRIKKLRTHLRRDCTEIPEGFCLESSDLEGENDDTETGTGHSRVKTISKGSNKKRKSSSSSVTAVTPPPVIEESMNTTVVGKRKVNPPKRLDLGWGADSKWRTECENHQRSTGSIYDIYPTPIQEIFDFLDETCGRNFQFDKEFPSLLPEESTLVSSSSTFTEQRMSSAACFLLSQVEEHKYLSKVDMVAENNEAKENSLLYPIMVSIHGPVAVYAKTSRKEIPPSAWNRVINGNNRFAISEEYYALPQPYRNPPKTSKSGRKRGNTPSPLPTDSQIPNNSSLLTMWTTPLLLDCHLSGSSFPIKVSFFSSILYKQVIGFVFSYNRHEEGYLVFSMNGGNVISDRIQSYEMNICALEQNDKGTISVIWNSVLNEPFLIQQVKGNEEDNDG
jgi:hypothetical protein